MTTLSLHLQASADLLKRYAAIFSHVWAQRKDMEPKPRLPHESAFLPAALELQETPVSPAPRIAMWLIIAFATIAVIWAVFGKIDVVATAQGRIVTSDRTKVIQPLEPSFVKAIHVRDGQAVKAGDVLIELDATSATADTARSTNDVTTMRLQAARAKAMLATIASGRPIFIVSVPDVDSSRIQQEQRILDGQYGEYQAKLARIDADLAKREAELNSTQQIVNKLALTAPIATQRAADFKNLVDKNFISKHGYLEKEQIRIETEGDLATQRSRLQELRAALAEGKSQRLSLIAETRRINLDTLNDAEQKATSYGQELLKSESYQVHSLNSGQFCLDSGVHFSCMGTVGNDNN